MRKQEERQQGIDRLVGTWVGRGPMSEPNPFKHQIVRMAQELLLNEGREGLEKVSQSQGADQFEDLPDKVEADLEADITDALESENYRVINLVTQDKDYAIARVLNRIFKDPRFMGRKPSTVLNLDTSFYPHYPNPKLRGGRLTKERIVQEHEYESDLVRARQLLTNWARTGADTIPILHFNSTDTVNEQASQGKEKIVPTGLYDGFLQASGGKVIVVSEHPVSNAGQTSRVKIIDVDDYSHGEMVKTNMKREIARFIDENMPDVLKNEVGMVAVFTRKGEPVEKSEVERALRNISGMLAGLKQDVNAYYEFWKALRAAYNSERKELDLGVIQDKMNKYYQEEASMGLSNERDNEALEYRTWEEYHLNPEKYITVPGSGQEKAMSQLDEYIEQVKAEFGPGVVQVEEPTEEYIQEALSRPGTTRRMAIDGWKSMHNQTVQQFPPVNMLVGPTGTGKTEFARAALSRLGPGYTLVRVNMDAIKDMWVGESEARLRRALNKLKELYDSIIIFDEVDAVLEPTSGDQPAGKLENQLAKTFQIWISDNAQRLAKRHCFIIMTTNEPDRIAVTFMNRSLVRNFGPIPFEYAGEMINRLVGVNETLMDVEGEHIGRADLKNYINSFDLSLPPNPEWDMACYPPDHWFGNPHNSPFLLHEPPGTIYSKAVMAGVRYWTMQIQTVEDQILSYQDLMRVADEFAQMWKTSVAAPRGTPGAPNRRRWAGPVELYQCFTSTIPTALSGGRPS